MKPCYPGTPCTSEILLNVYIVAYPRIPRISKTLLSNLQLYNFVNSFRNVTQCLHSGLFQDSNALDSRDTVLVAWYLGPDMCYWETTWTWSSKYQKRSEEYWKGGGMLHEILETAYHSGNQWSVGSCFHWTEQKQHWEKYFQILSAFIKARS